MIELEGIHKSFGKLEVLRGVSLEIPYGRVTAIVGPNGSGKTTLIKLLLGLAHANKGSVRIDGADVSGVHTYRKKIGYMPQLAKFPENLTCRETLNLLRTLRNFPESDMNEYPPFDLGAELNKKTRSLSGGARQKLSACAALMFDPALLILDEPTAGLDPISSHLFKRRIRAERDRGKTIVLTSHIMSEVQTLADYIVFLLDGRVRFKGALGQLLTTTGSTELETAVAALMEGAAA
ncbi:MAG: ABC transporter ATP-binding protein [Candidatus Zixiibacteriota bacterium]